MKPALKLSVAGFSLIELMIAITVLGLGLALAMPSYRTWIQNTHIRNAAESIQHGLQKARAEAVTRNTNVAFTLGAGAFWTVTQVSDGTVIESKSSGEISEYVIPIMKPDGASIITFSNLGGVADNTPASTTLRLVTIDSTTLPAADSRDLKITVGTTCNDEGGDCVGSVIRMCDPNVPVAVPPTDPRQCY